MRRIFGVGLAAVVAVAVTLGTAIHVNNREQQEQRYCEHSSEQGGLENIEFIGVTESRTSGTLGELAKKGIFQEGDAIYFNEHEYALFAGGEYIAEVRDEKTEKCTRIIVPYEAIEGFDVKMIKRPIRNRDFRGN
jgi:hypothetical protein